MAVGGSAAMLAFAVGYGVDANTTTTRASSSVTSTPTAPVTPAAPPGDASPVQPLGGGGCVIGLNCGCIPRITCPGAHHHHTSQTSTPQTP